MRTEGGPIPGALPQLEQVRFSIENCLGWLAGLAQPISAPPTKRGSNPFRVRCGKAGCEILNPEPNPTFSLTSHPITDNLDRVTLSPW